MFDAEYPRYSFQIISEIIRAAMQQRNEVYPPKT